MIAHGYKVNVMKLTTTAAAAVAAAKQKKKINNATRATMKTATTRVKTGATAPM